MNKFVFVCGAARSGTTLLMNLLDGHSQLSTFPNRETHILQYWHYHKRLGDLERFFLRDYLNSEDVLLLTNDSAMSQHGEYMQNKYGNVDYYGGRKPDRAGFIKLYLEYLTENGLGLENIYQALFRASLSINQIDFQNKIFIEKRPLDNEICATLLAERFPEVKFIHIVRDPRTRYLSAKMRRIRNNKGIYKFIDNYEGTDFATVHAKMSMVSLELARLNKLILKDRYHILRYEDLMDDPETEMKAIADFLGIEVEPKLLEPVSMGRKVSPSSSIAKTTTASVLKTKQDRVKRYYQETSRTEQAILRLLNWEIARDFNYDIEKLEFLHWTDVIYPLKYENPLQYLPNRIKMFKNVLGYSWSVKTCLYHTLIDKFYQGLPVSD